MAAGETKSKKAQETKGTVRAEVKAKGDVKKAENSAPGAPQKEADSDAGKVRVELKSAKKTKTEKENSKENTKDKEKKVPASSGPKAEKTRGGIVHVTEELPLYLL